MNEPCIQCACAVTFGQLGTFCYRRCVYWHRQTVQILLNSRFICNFSFKDDLTVVGIKIMSWDESDFSQEMETTPTRRGFSLLSVCLCTCIILCQWSYAEGRHQKNETHSERYPLVVFDFARVELPLVICLWVLIASLAKIGRVFFQCQTDVKEIWTNNYFAFPCYSILCLVHSTGQCIAKYLIVSNDQCITGG